MKSKVALTVYYDPSTGCIEDICEGAAFKRESPLFRADVLKDAAYMINDEYVMEVAVLHDEIEAQIEKARGQ